MMMEKLIVEMTCEESDLIILYFFNSESEYFDLTPEQVLKIKMVWREMNEFDQTIFYSFNDDMTKLRKTKVTAFEKKDVPAKLWKRKLEAEKHLASRERVSVYGIKYLRNNPVQEINYDYKI
jgi:hypothetical protein